MNLFFKELVIGVPSDLLELDCKTVRSGAIRAQHIKSWESYLLLESSSLGTFNHYENLLKPTIDA